MGVALSNLAEIAPLFAALFLAGARISTKFLIKITEGCAVR